MADAFLTRKGGENVTPEVTQQETIIQNITEALVGKVYGANATPETILKGYSAYVHQNLVEGTMEAGLSAAEFGFSKISTGSFTLASRTVANSVTMEHGLGETPKVVIIYAGECTSGSNYDINCLILDTVASRHPDTQNYIGAEGIYNSAYYNTATYVLIKSFKFTDSTMIYYDDSRYYRAGVQYNWIALA